MRDWTFAFNQLPALHHSGLGGKNQDQALAKIAKEFCHYKKIFFIINCQIPYLADPFIEFLKKFIRYYKSAAPRIVSKTTE